MSKKSVAWVVQLLLIINIFYWGWLYDLSYIRIFTGVDQLGVLSIFEIVLLVVFIPIYAINSLILLFWTNNIAYNLGILLVIADILLKLEKALQYYFPYNIMPFVVLLLPVGILTGLIYSRTYFLRRIYLYRLVNGRTR
jgi:hypothetical protein